MGKDHLIQELASLKDQEWFEVLERAQGLRRQNPANNAIGMEPNAHTSKDDLVAWLARRHLAVDQGIRAVIYLPDRAPANEIRLIEVDSLFPTADDEKPEVFDFTPDIAGLPFQVVAVDVTPAQWQQIKQGKPLLPDGWSLTGYQTVTRTQG